MINIFKTAYCFYVVQLLIHCVDDFELNKLLDSIIDNGKEEDFVQGDEDIKKVFIYVIEYRKYNRCLIDVRPHISGKVIAKVLVKSVF
jgi:hypothetical protein